MVYLLRPPQMSGAHLEGTWGGEAQEGRGVQMRGCGAGREFKSVAADKWKCKRLNIALNLAHIVGERERDWVPDWTSVLV